MCVTWRKTFERYGEYIIITAMPEDVTLNKTFTRFNDQYKSHVNIHVNSIQVACRKPLLPVGKNIKTYKKVNGSGRKYDK